MTNERNRIEVPRREIIKPSLDFHLASFDAEDKDLELPFGDIGFLFEHCNKNGEFSRSYFVELEDEEGKLDPHFGPGKVTAVNYVSRINCIRDNIGLNASTGWIDYLVKVPGEEREQGINEPCILTWQEFYDLGKPRVITERRTIYAK